MKISRCDECNRLFEHYDGYEDIEVIEIGTEITVWGDEVRTFTRVEQDDATMLRLHGWSKRQTN